MPHKFNVGTSVHYDGGTIQPGVRAPYKIVRQLPVERDNRLPVVMKPFRVFPHRSARRSMI